MKKTAAVLFFAILAASLLIHGFAGAPQALKALHGEFSEQIFDITLDNGPISKDSLQELTAYPRSVLEIVLTGSEDADLFLDQNGAPINTADVTASRLRAAEVSVMVDAYEGSLAVQSAELSVGDAGGSASKPVIVVNFAKSFEALEPVYFSFDIFITLEGIRQPQSKISVSGLFGNEEMAVEPGTESIIPDGAVMVAGARIPAIEIDAGYGVFVTASMRPGARYRVVSAPSSGYEDLEALSLDSRLVDIIALNYSGFDHGELRGVRINTEESLYIYDENGGFIGMTADLLPPARKYFLASRKIEAYRRKYL